MGSAKDSPRPLNTAYAVLAVLTAMNLLNYVDRYILASVIGPVQEGLHFDDEDAGVVMSAFLVSYTLFSPAVGWVGDRVPRKYLVALGVGLWSLATFFSGWANSFGQMLGARVVLGVGEASYAILAPGIIGDLFVPSRRNRVLTIFYLAIPVGAALGSVLGGQINAHYGWRTAFHAVGLPGLALALVALVLPEPKRGETELAEEGAGGTADTAPLRAADYLALARNRSFILDTLGMALMSFALGGLQSWVTKYLAADPDPTRPLAAAAGTVGLLGSPGGAGPLLAASSLAVERPGGPMPLHQVTFWLGAVMFLSSILGTSAGGALAGLWSKRQPGAYFLVSGLGMLLAIPFTLIALLSRPYPVVFVSTGAALMFGVFNFGPSNTILVNVTRPRIRAAAIAANLLLIHWLGDIPSIVLAGSVSSWTQKAGIAAGPKEGLFWGLMLMVPAMALSGLFFCWGARHFRADREAVLREVRAS
jgi:MFS family permease